MNEPTNETSATLFRAYREETLPGIEFQATRDEAIEHLLRMERDDPDAAARHPMVVEQVRVPNLGDFFNFGDLVSVMRERMASMIGNDDALSDASVNDAVAKLADADIRLALTAAAGLAGMRIDGYIVVTSVTEGQVDG